MAYADALVSTQWVDEHRDDPGVRLVEVDADTNLYELAHIPGAINWNWVEQLEDPVRRDILSRGSFEELMARSGVANDSTVVLYGDHGNWFACWALWQMRLYGHRDVRVMDGGRGMWLQEGREVTTGPEQPRAERYSASEADGSLRATLEEVRSGVESGAMTLIDVRSPDEYSGAILAPPGIPESCQRGGHIPGAKNIPWSLACNDDGTFLAESAMRRLFDRHDVRPEHTVITYCRIGERSSHTWFVLKHLLDFPDVRNYDGSWVEWGNAIGLPIERS